MKVKIINGSDAHIDKLEAEINEFMKDKEIISVQSHLCPTGQAYDYVGGITVFIVYK